MAVITLTYTHEETLIMWNGGLREAGSGSSSFDTSRSVVGELIEACGDISPDYHWVLLSGNSIEEGENVDRWLGN